MPELPLAEAAARLGISTDSIRRQIKKGELQGHRGLDGRLIVTVPDELLAGGASGEIWNRAGSASANVMEPSAASGPEQPVGSLSTEAQSRIHDLEATVTRLTESLNDALVHNEREISLLTARLNDAERYRETLETMLASQGQQLEAAQRQAEADTQAQSELRQLLLRAQLQVEALIPKLPAPEPEAKRPWWWLWG